MAKRSIFSSYTRLLIKVYSAGKVAVLPGTGSFIINGTLNSLFESV